VNVGDRKAVRGSGSGKGRSEDVDDVGESGGICWGGLEPNLDGRKYWHYDGQKRMCDGGVWIEL